MPWSLAQSRAEEAQCSAHRPDIPRDHTHVNYLIILLPNSFTICIQFPESKAKELKSGEKSNNENPRRERGKKSKERNWDGLPRESRCARGRIERTPRAPDLRGSPPEKMEWGGEKTLFPSFFWVFIYIFFVNLGFRLWLDWFEFEHRLSLPPFLIMRTPIYTLRLWVGASIHLTSHIS